jgi:hypothetical protein
MSAQQQKQVGAARVLRAHIGANVEPCDDADEEAGAHQLRRLHPADRDQRAEAHQQAAVAVEANHRPVRPRQRDAEPTDDALPIASESPAAMTAVRLACVFPRGGSPSAVGLVRQSRWWPVAQTMTTTLPWVCPSPTYRRAAAAWLSG